jgi:hypothetical protein
MSPLSGQNKEDGPMRLSLGCALSLFKMADSTAAAEL